MPYRDAPGLSAVLAALPGTRLVGGCVRDALVGVPSADIDLATPLRPEAVTAALEAAGLRAIPTGLAHGTVTALADGRTYEVTTLRHDVETDGRHATVAFTDDWRADAARRDFTINAMSMTPDGEVSDHFGGAADLAAGRVRFVGRAEDRVREDYLRILRFFRFWTRYGRGDPDTEAVAAIAAHVDGLDRLSVERIATELLLILRAPDPGPALRLMAALGVLARILPEPALEPPLSLGERAKDGKLPLPPGEGWGEGRAATVVAPDPLLRFASFTGPHAIEAARRLKLSGAEIDRLAAWAGPLALAPDATDAAIRQALEDARACPDPRDALDGRIALAHPADPAWQSLRARIAATPVPVFPLQGRDLAALGVPPGPGMGRLLAGLRAWWRDGGCVADADACRAELARRLTG